MIAVVLSTSAASSYDETCFASVLLKVGRSTSSSASVHGFDFSPCVRDSLQLPYSLQVPHSPTSSPFQEAILPPSRMPRAILCPFPTRQHTGTNRRSGAPRVVKPHLFSSWSFMVLGRSSSNTRFFFSLLFLFCSSDIELRARVSEHFVQQHYGKREDLDLIFLSLCA